MIPPAPLPPFSMYTYFLKKMKHVLLFNGFCQLEQPTLSKTYDLLTFKADLKGLTITYTYVRHFLWQKKMPVIYLRQSVPGISLFA